MSQSSCLYDDGEESWLLKIHAGCGGIYLTDPGTGYLNFDIDGKLAVEYPALRDKNATTIKDYYARLDGDAHNLPTRRETVADCLLDLSIGLPYLPETVDKIVTVQFFEHLSPARALMVLRGWYDILKIGHPLVMSVPDMSGVLDMMDATRDMHNDRAIADFEFALRHLRGRRTNHYNSHHAWYTVDTLGELLSFVGFEPHLLPNFHFYPALVMRGIKR